MFEGEPGANSEVFETDTTRNKNVYGTHHIGASTLQASESIGKAVVEIVSNWKQKGIVLNCVNLIDSSGADHLLSVRHKDEVGVLAAILGLLREDGHNIQEMENIIFKGGNAASAKIRVIGSPSKQLQEKLLEHEHIFALTVTSLVQE